MQRNVKLIGGFILAVVALLVAGPEWGRTTTKRGAGTSPSAPETSSLRTLVETQQSGVMIELEGIVDRVLSDDLKGSRHQRFILKVGDGRTVLVSHNIDLADKVPLQRRDTVTLYGQYEWNEKGGVVHWTHHDPKGRHADGWIQHEGRRYQ